MLPNQQSDEDETLPPEAEGQDASTEEQADEGDQPLTRAEFEAMWAKREQDLTRRLQSMTDKAESRIAKRYGELSAGNKRAVEVAKTMGMTPEQIAAYEKRLDDDAMRQAVQGQPPDGSGQGEPGEDGVDFEQYRQQVWGEGAEIAAEVGGIFKTDPEAVLVITKGSREQYLNSMKYAAQMKARRLQADKSAPAKPAQVPGLVRGGKAPPKNPIQDINSADELYEMGWGEMKKRASG